MKDFPLKVSQYHKYSKEGILDKIHEVEKESSQILISFPFLGHHKRWSHKSEREELKIFQMGDLIFYVGAMSRHIFRYIFRYLYQISFFH
jgi:hypothetical protein